jgi:hypothetical protein
MIVGNTAHAEDLPQTKAPPAVLSHEKDSLNPRWRVFFDDFFFGTHLTFSFHTGRASLANVRSS